MEQNTFSTSLIVGILLALAFGELAIFLIKKWSRHQHQGSSNQDSDSVSTTNHKDDFSENNQSKKDEIDSTGQKDDSNLSAKTKCIIKVTLVSPYIKKFATSIGALLPIIKDGNEDGMGKLAFDNLDLIISAINSPELKKEWDSFSKDRLNWDDAIYKDKAASFIDVLKNAGVEIVYEHKILWNDKSALRYRKFSKVEKGDECEVLSPFALYNGTVIEQGIVKKIN